MAATAPAALLAELEDVIRIGSPVRQARILRRVTELFQAAADRLDQLQTDVFDDVFVRLIERVDTQSLAHLSIALSRFELAPRETVRQLALHSDISVAAPMLTNSSCLRETHLIEIANKAGRQHLLAISARTIIGEALSDVLIRRGDPEMFSALAQNPGARFSESGYVALVGKAERDESLIEGLGLRSDIPAKLLRKVLAVATDAVWARLSRAARSAAPDKAQSATMAAQQNPIDYAQAFAQIVALNRAGKLNDSPMNRFAIRGEYIHVVAALSFTTEVGVEEIEPLIRSDRLYGLIVACRAARLDWATTSTIIRCRPGCPPASQQEIEQGREIFEALLLSVAQWTVRFGLSQSAPEKVPRAQRG